MSRRKANQYFHVYILVSEGEENVVKVGKANNLSRTRSLARMGYAGKDDWLHIASFPMNSNHEALALESLVIAKLSNQGHKLPRVSWKNLINGKPSYADECFSCSAEHAIAVASDMATLLEQHL
ncbi:GIY-YIG nuclease family protein [Halomonas sp. I5-271120]|uniref:GIY-YIG nuclease family protein n=1 Tax=Halomonas sp. I5-271120 TaxID=3061632 RepID=UPI0027148E23|nr:GIY-YIG nuclease family protein [Halomonas sp. I5-271120]